MLDEGNSGMYAYTLTPVLSLYEEVNKDSLDVFQTLTTFTEKHSLGWSKLLQVTHTLRDNKGGLLNCRKAKRNTYL